MDPSLHSINHMLMEDDATCMQHDDASYQAILCSFYDILGKRPPPNISSLVSPSTSNHLHIDPHQIPEEPAASRALTLPINANLQSSFFVVPGLTLSPDSANFDALSTQDYHAAIKFNQIQSNSLSTHDTMISGWEKSDKSLTNSRTSRSCRGSANAQFQLPSPYKELYLELPGVDFSFQDLKLRDHYAALYVGEGDIPAEAPNFGTKKKGLADVAGKGGKSAKRRTADLQECVNLKELIVDCAQAVAVGDARAANEILRGLRQVHGVSADGNGLQRAVHYFGEALVARMRGTGGHHFRAIVQHKPSVVTKLTLCKLWFEVDPVLQVAHFFANRSILKAAERASRLHIVDYGSEHGMQWLFLIYALADQKGGPPLLVITSIDFPQPGNNPAGRLEESGRRLAAHARTYNVPFQYHAIASSRWEDLHSSSFHFHEDEVLVVNCIKSLHLVTADQSVDSVSPRQKMLMCIHSLKPHLLLTAHVSAAYNSSFFVSRFREALHYYSSLFDMVDSLWGDIPERLLKEKSCYFGKILNIVACEGKERVERAETYKQWEVRIKRAGFEQLLIPPKILWRSRRHVEQHYHKDFFVHEDANKWMLLGWRGRTAVGISAWEPSRHGANIVRKPAHLATI